jgi:hypothetical protein
MGNKSAPKDIKIEYDNSSGSLVDISAYVQKLGDVSVESLVEQCRAFGEEWERALPIGVGKMANVDIEGDYDDEADVGPDALFWGARDYPEAPSTASRTLKITWQGTKSTSVETWLVKRARTPDLNALTKYKVTLGPTGTVTEA